MKGKVWLYVTFGILVFDQLLKFFMRNLLASSQSIILIPKVLHLTLVFNTGAGFGILKDQRVFFILISIAVLYLLWKEWKKFQENTAVPLGLLIGGLLGNLFDRVAFGSVTDFIDFRVWPVFNVADSAISIAAVWLAVLLWKQDKKT